MSPSLGDKGAKPLGAITVSFSEPLASSSPLPGISPLTQGTWQLEGSRAVFHPSVAFVPQSDISLTVPGGSKGMRAADGAHLRAAFRSHFFVQTGSVLRLQELLSLLDYSPLSWRPSSTPIPTTDVPAQLAALYEPPKGTFSWNQTGWPAELTSLWEPGKYNVMTRGLVMEFQADHGLVVNGHQSAGLWNDLVKVLSSGETNTGGYNFALVNKTPPESLTIWHDAKVVLATPANTGIASDPTANGTYPVFAKYRAQVMHGTNPNGQPYADPVQFVSYFHGGEAVHFMPRPDYGIPQSLGCVELPLASAAQAWPWLAYGTLVTVIS